MLYAGRSVRVYFPIRLYMAEEQTCRRCHEECKGECTGPGPDNCMECKHVRDGPYCVPACPVSKYNSNNTCLPCHETCYGGCKGPEHTIGNNGCNSCEKAIIKEDRIVSNSIALFPFFTSIASLSKCLCRIHLNVLVRLVPKSTQ